MARVTIKSLQMQLTEAHDNTRRAHEAEAKALGKLVEREYRVNDLKRRRDDLLAANNRYLARARTAEADNVVQYNETAFWKGEAETWAKAYADQRQSQERQFAKVNDWLHGLSQHGRWLVIMDFLICFLGLLVIAGFVPPVIVRP